MVTIMNEWYKQMLQTTLANINLAKSETEDKYIKTLLELAEEDIRNMIKELRNVGKIIKKE